MELWSVCFPRFSWSPLESINCSRPDETHVYIPLIKHLKNGNWTVRRPNLEKTCLKNDCSFSIIFGSDIDNNIPASCEPLWRFLEVCEGDIASTYAVVLYRWMLASERNAMHSIILNTEQTSKNTRGHSHMWYWMSISTRCVLCATN